MKCDLGIVGYLISLSFLLKLDLCLCVWVCVCVCMFLCPVCIKVIGELKIIENVVYLLFICGGYQESKLF